MQLEIDRDKSPRLSSTLASSLRIVLLGIRNAGKSSLMNNLFSSEIRNFFESFHRGHKLLSRCCIWIPM